MFRSPVSFFAVNLSNKAPTDRSVYAVNGRNPWQYFAGLHQDMVRCWLTRFYFLQIRTLLFPRLQKEVTVTNLAEVRLRTVH